jgi:hypothetical protein
MVSGSRELKMFFRKKSTPEAPSMENESGYAEWFF